MKCQKCSKPAVIHLTEIVTDTIGAKRAVEIHLCLHHAAEAGIIAPGSEILPQVLSANPLPPATPKKGDSSKGASIADTGLPTAIVPASPPSAGGLVVARDKGNAGDPVACPLCGLSWSQFKQSGLMGCSHDYALYESKLLPLLKRAQEGSADHVGKIPKTRKTQDTNRQVETLRLQRDLQKAVDAEDYENAARLRDRLKHLETEN